MLFFLLILGLPFLIGLAALFRPDLLEQVIREPPSRIPPG